MEKFITLTGVAAPLAQANLDTDQLMPKQFLRGIDRKGLGAGFLFHHRFVTPEEKRPEFILNRAPWSGAAILIVGPNFGCGSSREHAVWGLRELGIRCIIGTTFGGIFSDNCARNGVPAIALPPQDVDYLLALACDPASCEMTIDLAAQTITTSGNREAVTFDFDPLLRRMLLEGLDAVGLTLESSAQIQEFEARHLATNDWLR